MCPRLSLSSTVAGAAMVSMRAAVRHGGDHASPPLCMCMRIKLHYITTTTSHHITPHHTTPHRHITSQHIT